MLVHFIHRTHVLFCTPLCSSSSYTSRIHRSHRVARRACRRDGSQAVRGDAVGGIHPSSLPLSLPSARRLSRSLCRLSRAPVLSSAVCFCPCPSVCSGHAETRRAPAPERAARHARPPAPYAYFARLRHACYLLLRPSHRSNRPPPS